MPVRKHKLETSDREAFGDSHIVVRGPLAPRDSAALHRHRRERVLTLHGVESDSFEFLADWSELRGLRLHDCGVGDWSALAGRARLEQVVIHTMRDRAVDFSFLSRLKGLRELSIGYGPT